VSSFWAETWYKVTHSAKQAHFFKEIVLELHYNPYLKSLSLIFFYSETVSNLWLCFPPY